MAAPKVRRTGDIFRQKTAIPADGRRVGGFAPGANQASSPIPGNPGRGFGGEGEMPSSPQLVVSFTGLATEKYLYRTPGFSYEALQSPLFLPCVVEDFAFQEQASWTDFTSVAGGDYSTPGAGGPSARKQRTLPLRILATDFIADWIPNYIPPDDLYAELSTILRCRKPFKLAAAIFPSPGYSELTMNATLRSLDRALLPGQASVRYFSIELVEHRTLSVGRRVASRAKGPVKLPTTVKIQPGDTLRKFAQKFYGSPSRWRDIARANDLYSWGGNDDLSLLLQFPTLFPTVQKSFKIPALRAVPKVVQTSAQQMTGS